jgi:single-strand DNA-binding protein
MNTVNLVGNLVHDIELKTSQTGKSFATFSIAVNREVNGEKQVSYFDCTVWGDQATNAAESLKKGDRVMVFGGLTQRTFERKDGTKGSAVEVRVSDIGPSLTWAKAIPQKLARA